MQRAPTQARAHSVLSCARTWRSVLRLVTIMAPPTFISTMSESEGCGSACSTRCRSIQACCGERGCSCAGVPPVLLPPAATCTTPPRPADRIGRGTGSSVSVCEVGASVWQAAGASDAHTLVTCAPTEGRRRPQQQQQRRTDECGTELVASPAGVAPRRSVRQHYCCI
jgi:hypothetical protein